jgi:4-carboxymuconolactone decarboxylase
MESMEKNRYARGVQKLAEIDGTGGQGVIDSLQNIAPDLGKYIIEFAFGDIYSRDGLNLQEREMVTITSLLTAGGCEPQLDVHINGALNVGVTPEKIVETFLQCIPYTGFPKVLNAITVAKKIFADREITLKTISSAKPRD